MKTLTFSINLNSFLLGALTVIGLVLLINFTPATKTQPTAGDEIRRYQVVMGEKGAIILDTKTGTYIYDRSFLGKPSWISGDFEELQSRKK